MKNPHKFLGFHLAAVLVVLSFPYVVHAQVFEDVSGGQWFSPFVYQLVNEKVLDARPKYFPGANIDRAQALKLLLESADIDTENTQ
jgi:hypothetical protein